MWNSIAQALWGQEEASEGREMSWQQVSGNPFFTMALPIVLTLIWAAISQNRGFSELGKRIDDIARGLERIENKLGAIKSRHADEPSPSAKRRRIADHIGTCARPLEGV